MRTLALRDKGIVCLITCHTLGMKMQNIITFVIQVVCSEDKFRTDTGGSNS